MAPQFDRALRDLLKAAGCVLLRQGNGSNEIWHSPITNKTSPFPREYQVGTLQMPFCDKLVFPKPFDYTWIAIVVTVVQETTGQRVQVNAD